MGRLTCATVTLFLRSIVRPGLHPVPAPQGPQKGGSLLPPFANGCTEFGKHGSRHPLNSDLNMTGTSHGVSLGWNLEDLYDIPSCSWYTPVFPTHGVT